MFGRDRSDQISRIHGSEQMSAIQDRTWLVCVPLILGPMYSGASAGRGRCPLTCTSLSLFLLPAMYTKNSATTIAIIPRGTPTPMPIFAFVERPEGLPGGGCVLGSEGIACIIR